MVFYVWMIYGHGFFTTNNVVDLMLATIPSVFQDIYHFEVQYTGLAYIGCRFTHIVREYLHGRIANDKRSWPRPICAWRLKRSCLHVLILDRLRSAS